MIPNVASIQQWILPWLIPLIIWSAIWKGFGLWKSARNKQFVWFIVMFVINSAGILPILYIYFFQKNKEVIVLPKVEQKKPAKKARKK